MSRIAERLRELKNEGGYVPYICGGDPDIEFSTRLLREACLAGADVVELGIPFSDPIADGPTIQEAMQRALSDGFRPRQTFDMIRRLREEFETPVVVMSYYNPILQMGLEEFCAELAGCGGDGLLVVDLPPEESAELDEVSREHGLDMIRLITPSTTRERLKSILPKASGFVYAVSVAGTTGARGSLKQDSIQVVQKLREESDLPVMLGFGISSPEQVRTALRGGASGVVEGSKIINTYEGSLDNRERALAVAREHMTEMKSATRG